VGPQSDRRRSLLDLARAHGLAIAAWLWAAAYLLGTRTQPLRMNWGDPLSDSNVQTSGRYFATYGFVRLRFTPVIDVGPLDAHSLQYTHYPPLPDLVNGLQQSLFGPLDIGTFRILADVLTLASLVFFYRWVRALWGGVTANVTLVLMTTNFLWLQYADTIHHVPLYWCAGFAALHGAVRWVETKQRNLLFLVVAAIFFCNMASYDYFVFVPVAIAVTIWMKGQRLRDRAMRPLLAAVVAGIALALVVKFGLVAWATGPRNLVDDFVFQLHERATAKHSISEYRSGLLPTLFYRSLRFFTPVFFVVIAAQLLAIGGRLSSRGDRARLPPISPLLLLACGAPFVVVFTQLFVEQYHPTLQFLPYYAVSTGAFVAWLWERRATAARAVAVAAVVLAVGWEGRELVLFEKTFLERDDIVAVHDYLAKHDKRRVVFTNSWVDAPIRFYFDHHLMGIGASTRADVDSFMSNYYFEDGDEPFHYIEFIDADATAFDKSLYGIFGKDHKWSWITNPVPHKKEILESLRLRGEGGKKGFADYGRLVLETPRIRVYVLEREALDRPNIAAVSAAETRFIDFGSDSSGKHKVSGLRYNERSESGESFCWTVARPQKRYRFTMRGLLHETIGTADVHAILRVRSTPADAKVRILVLAPVPDQQAEVLWNGTSLGHAAAPTEWKELVFDLPKTAYDPAAPLQTLELRTAKVSEFGFGVAIQWIRIDPVTDPPP